MLVCMLHYVTQHMGLQQSFTALLKTQQSAASLINFIPELRMLLLLLIEKKEYSNHRPTNPCCSPTMVVRFQNDEKRKR